MTKPEYGFEYAADGVTLVPNAIEQKTLQVIDRLRSQGMSLREIEIFVESAIAKPKRQVMDNDDATE